MNDLEKIKKILNDFEHEKMMIESKGSKINSQVELIILLAKQIIKLSEK